MTHYSLHLYVTIQSLNPCSSVPHVTILRLSVRTCATPQPTRLDCRSFPVNESYGNAIFGEGALWHCNIPSEGALWQRYNVSDVFGLRVYMHILVTITFGFPRAPCI